MSQRLLRSIGPFYVFIFTFLLITQLGKHFFFTFSYLSGIRIDYLAPTLYLMDILSIPFLFYSIRRVYLLPVNANKPISLAILVLTMANLYFSLSWYLWLYGLARIIQWAAIIYFFKTEANNKAVFSAAVYGLLLGCGIELAIALTQLAQRHSIQGLAYYLGERDFTIATPGIAKAYFLGKEFLRPYGTFSHPNSLAGFYLLIYTFVLTHKRITHPILKIMFLFLTSALVLLSFSRTNIVIYALINLVYFSKNMLTCRICLYAKITMALFLLTFAFNISGDMNSLLKRGDFTKKSLSIISKSPFTGTGLGTYLIAQHRYPQKFSTFFEQPVHNIFLLTVAQLGIPLSLLLFTLTIRIIKPKLEITAFTLPLLVILLTGTVDHYWITLQQNVLVTAVIFGILLSYGKEEKASRT